MALGALNLPELDWLTHVLTYSPAHLKGNTMTKFLNYAVVLFAILFSPLTMGCGNSAPDAEHEDEHADHDEHDHAALGPHGGDVVELGSEDYHAEVVHEDDSVTVYMLDSTARRAQAVDASEILVNARHAGRAEQFRLAALPDEGPAGMFSRYASTDPELFADVASGHAEVEVVVNISGKQYRGSLEHHHDAPGHDHPH
jgi:hypothetical protein